MRDCDNNVKRSAIRWWTLVPAKSVTLPKDGCQCTPGSKRTLDLALIVLTCPIWLPLMLIVMAAIKNSSPGPIFYRQERVGFRGRSFMIFKFRSMKVHAQTSWHEWHFQRLMRDGAPMTKLDIGDDRIIPW